jgi:hypothetical protein
MEEKNDMFFQWVVSLFKKSKPQPPPEKTQEELAWEKIRTNYQLEYSDQFKAFLVKIHVPLYNEWWYLEKYISEGHHDFTVSSSNGSAIRLLNAAELDYVIKDHQNWLKAGHAYLISR